MKINKNLNSTKKSPFFLAIIQVPEINIFNDFGFIILELFWSTNMQITTKYVQKTGITLYCSAIYF